ncbi:hypothetical protein GCM10027447_38970 [Glycomyces halotolerans]
MRSARFGDSKIEREILSDPLYRRVVISVRLTYSIIVGGVVLLALDFLLKEKSIVWEWGIAAVLPFLAVTALNVQNLSNMIRGGNELGISPMSGDAAQTLFDRALVHAIGEAIFIVRKSRN